MLRSAGGCIRDGCSAQLAVLLTFDFCSLAVILPVLMMPAQDTVDPLAPIGPLASLNAPKPPIGEGRDERAPGRARRPHGLTFLFWPNAAPPAQAR